MADESPLPDELPEPPPDHGMTLGFMSEDLRRARTLLRRFAPQSLRSPERAVVILRSLQDGSSRIAAASLAEISHDTMSAWMRDDPVFKQLVEEAEGRGEARLFSQIASAGHREWQAAAWILERRYPDRWGRRDSLTVNLEMERLVQQRAEEAGVDPAEVLAEVERMRAARAKKVEEPA